MPKYFRVLVYLSFLFMPGFIYGQQAKNISLVGRLQYQQFLTDIWGYAADDGTEYALVGTREGLSIVSLADPARPQQVQFAAGVPTAWRDIKTYRHYAYVSNEGGNGLQIIDLQNLPNQIAVKDTIIAGAETSHNLWIDENGILYIVGLDRGLFNGGMLMCDLKEDPWNPRLVGVYDHRYVHDVYVRNNLAYAAEIYAHQLTIIDVSDKADPTELSSRTYHRAATHNTWLNDAGDVCFTTDETSDVYVRAWDVRNPASIQALDSVRSSLSRGEAIPHNVHVLNDYLVTSYYKDGIHLTDAHRPDVLVEVGYYDTSPASGVGTDGCWGAYPFLPSGLILASDIEEGLFVLQPHYLRAAYLEGQITDAASLQPLDEVIVRVLDETEVAYSQADGSYKFGLARDGRLQVVYYKFGFLPDTLEVALTAGQTTLQNVALTPAPLTSFEVLVKDTSSGQPLPAALLQAIPLGVDQAFDFQTDSSGLAQATDLPAGIYRLIVGKWGYLTQQVEIQPTTRQQIVVLLSPGYYDDFALDFGWETEGDATAGQWERARPKLTTRFGIPLNPGEDLLDDKGDQAYVTGNESQTYFDNDVDNGFTLLRSPVFDLSQQQDPVIAYYWWLINYIDNTNGQAGNGFLEVRISNSQQTAVVATYSNSFNGDRWNLSEFRVRDFLQPDEQMRIEFVAADPEPGNLVEAGVDGFSVRDLASTSLPEKNAPLQLSVFPNPPGQHLFVQVPQPLPYPLSLRLVDASGRQLYQSSLPAGTHVYSLPFPYPAGLYLLEVRKRGKLLSVHKLFKR